MAYTFKREIKEIFYSCHQYSEQKRGRCIRFEICGDITFEQLEKLSNLLGTKNINYNPVGYDDYICGGIAFIEAKDIVFPT